MKQYLTIDIGRNWLRWSITNERLDVSKHGKKEIKSVTEREDVFIPIEELARQFKDQVDGLCITMPGVIDTETGTAYSGGVYSWVVNEPLGLEIQESTGLKTIILNDAKAAALAEVGYGALKGVRNGVMLMLLGTGIGGAIIRDGKILNGEHFAAGEFSYLSDAYERPSNNEDVFALSCSLNGLTSIVKETTGSENMNILKIMFGLNRNNEGIKQGVKKYCDRLANYIYNIQCVIDAEVFIISGNITDEPMFMQMIQGSVDERFQHALVPFIFQPDIKGVTFHEDSGKYGAVYAFQQRELEQK